MAGARSYLLTASVSEPDPRWYAGHVPVLGGESPLRSRESEPLSEGKGATVRWGLKEAGATATTRRTEIG